MEGRLIVITGPSGVGKGTLVRSLLHDRPDLYLSVSATTRAPRPGEVEGRDYYFVDRENFESMIGAGKLLEWAEYAGNYYGTPLEGIENLLKKGGIVILEIELQGARQIEKTFPGARRIFIEPPDFLELEKRLRERGKDSGSAIVRRLEKATEELAARGEFPYRIVNDDLATALEELKKVIFGPDSHPPERVTIEEPQQKPLNE